MGTQGWQPNTWILKIVKVDHLICRIKEYFSPNGTILVPAFTYSFTKGEDYHIDKTSSVGLFSERFRHRCYSH